MIVFGQGDKLIEEGLKVHELCFHPPYKAHPAYIQEVRGKVGGGLDGGDGGCCSALKQHK